MPPGLEVTVPHPVPGTDMYRLTCDTSKVAVQLFGVSIVTLVSCALPLQSSPQPVNVDPGAGVAVSVTTVPGA